ncbi:MAG: VOC family protein [Bryobacterales bacterium]|nr:VOC family protein [Bryobacterales bacterium]
MAQQFHIDHVTIAGKNVEAMEKALRAAGIASEYGGPHSNHATEMALASFPDGSYLELIAIQPKADPDALAAHEWRKFLESDGGPCAWAIRPVDFSAEVKRLGRASVEITGPRKNGRKRPDGVQLDWETAQVGPTNGGFFPFMIHDFTPRDLRAFPSGKPTTTDWTGVVKVVIGVKDLNSAITRYRQAYGLSAPLQQEDAVFAAKLAWFPGTPVVLAAPLSSQSWLTTRLQRFGEAPCAFVLGVANGSIDQAAPSKWFGASIYWADAERLGWHLGFEAK